VPINAPRLRLSAVVASSRPNRDNHSIFECEKKLFRGKARMTSPSAPPSYDEAMGLRRKRQMMTAKRIAIIELVCTGQLDAVRRQIAAWGKNARQMVNQTDEMGYSAVLAAVHANDLAMLQLLLFAGAEPDSQDGFGITPLSAAQRDGYTQVAAALQRALHEKQTGGG
jgi:hypothetical protein